MTNIITIVILLISIILAIRIIINNKKKGKNIICGGDCKSCQKKCY